MADDPADRPGMLPTEDPPGGVPSPWPASIDAAAQVFVDDLASPEITEEDDHHLCRVLRLRPGAVVVAADGTGRWRPCRLAPGGLQVDGPVVHCPAPTPAVTVAFVPVKGERPEWVVQKLTELGVDRIVVLRSARSVVRWDRGEDDARRALDRLARVARAAAAQSRRPTLPRLEGITDLAATATALAPVPLAVADPSGGQGLGEHTAVAVGPEGGWTDDELAVAGPHVVGLGPTVLRAETAAVAVGVLLCTRRRIDITLRAQMGE
jgi:16S rRNA (uracil1498-N3)-methyltransferase